MQQIMVETEPGVSLNVILRNEAPVRFVMVHGLASNARLYDGVAETLAEWGYGSIAIDLRGHGQSSKPSTGYDHETISRDLYAAITALHDEASDYPAVWIGQSWGAAVVSEFALRNPHLVGSLILIDGGLVDLKWEFPDWQSCKERLTPPDLSRTSGAELETWMRNSHPDWSDLAIAGSLANMEFADDNTVRPRLSRQHHMEILEELYRYTPLTILTQIQVPIRFLLADRANSPFVAQRERAISAFTGVPNATFEIFENSDHDLHAQHPRRVATVARDVLVAMMGVTS